MIILSPAYLGNIQYFCKLLGGGCVVDIHEHYVKQSWRTRCEILTANGRTSLTVPVVRPGNFDKSAVKDVRVDYSLRWQHRHWQSLVSAYRSSPFFEYYEDSFRPFYFGRDHATVADLDIALTSAILRLLGCDGPPVLSAAYMEAGPGDADLRNSLSPKPRLHVADPHFAPAPYYQVFSHTLPFEPNLSVVDLIFCEGPQAKISINTYVI